MRHYYTQDANFNVTAVTDDAGSILERYQYRPYGEVLVLDANFATDGDGLSDVENEITFTGRRFDAESGLYYFRNRLHHAQLGLFVSRDPLGYVDGLSLYRAYFVPHGVDPSGLDLLGELSLLGGTLAELPGAVGNTFASGEAGDSALGAINGMTGALNPFGGGIPVGPVYGHSAAYGDGQYVGYVGGTAMNAAMTVYGAHGTAAALHSATRGGGLLALEGGLSLAPGAVSSAAAAEAAGSAALTGWGNMAFSQNMGGPEPGPGGNSASGGGAGSGSGSGGSGQASRPCPKTKLSDRVTNELPPGQTRTPAENAQARNFFERNRDAARRWWEDRTGRQWPSDATHYEHPRPLADGGDPLFVEPGVGGPHQPHMRPGSDGLSDFQRWGMRGGRPPKSK